MTKAPIQLRKVWVGTAGNVMVSIDQGDTNIDSAVADGENASTDANTVDTGDYSVSETFTPAGSADDYASELACFNDNGAGTGGVADDGIKNGDEPVVSSTNGSVSVATGDDIVCTFTNTRDEGSIERRKVWVGTAGN